MPASPLKRGRLARLGHTCLPCLELLWPGTSCPKQPVWTCNPCPLKTDEICLKSSDHVPFNLTTVTTTSLKPAPWAGPGLPQTVPGRWPQRGPGGHMHGQAQDGVLCAHPWASRRGWQSAAQGPSASCFSVWRHGQLSPPGRWLQNCWEASGAASGLLPRLPLSPTVPPKAHTTGQAL